MLERDPFGKEGVKDISAISDQDRYSIEGGQKDSGESVFGSEADHASERANDTQFKQKKTRAWVIGGLVVSGIVLIVLAVVGFLWYRANLFKVDRVLVSLEGPDTTTGDNTEHFILTLNNQNGVDLQNGTVSFRFPENFIPEERDGLKRNGTTSARLEVGTIGARQQKAIDIYGYFSGTTESAVYVRAVFQFSLKNTSGSFQRDTQKTIRMESSMVGVSMTLPLELATGDLVEIAVQYTNRGKGDALFSGRLKMEYPEGFTFQGSDIKPSEGNTVWYLDPLGVGETKVLKLRGRILGGRDTIKQFIATVGVVRGDNSFVVYGKDQKKLQIVGSPFSIQLVTKSENTRFVSLGTNVECTLSYINQGDAGLKDAIVRVVLDGRIFDDAKVRLDRGSYDASTRTITWRASDVPDLAFMEPKKSGTITFSLPVRQTIPIETANDTQLTGSALASIDSVDVPDRIGTRRIVAQDFLEMSLATNVSMVTDLREGPTNANLPDVRFEVGKETELVVYTRLRNTYNDVAEGKFTVSIPSGVIFLGIIPLEGNENVTYNERSQQLVWEVGKIKAATGVLSPDRVIAYRIKVIPQEYQLNSKLTLLNSGEFHGRDVFVDEPISVVQAGVDAPRISPKGGVQERF